MSDSDSKSQSYFDPSESESFAPFTDGMQIIKRIKIDKSQKFAYYHCNISSQLSINGTPNGGYLAALALKAVRTEFFEKKFDAISKRFDVVSLTGYFVRASVPGPGLIEISNPYGSNNIFHVVVKQMKKSSGPGPASVSVTDDQKLPNFTETRCVFLVSMGERSSPTMATTVDYSLPPNSDNRTPDCIRQDNKHNDKTVTKSNSWFVFDGLPVSTPPKIKKLYSVMENTRLHIPKNHPYTDILKKFFSVETQSSKIQTVKDQNRKSKTVASLEGLCGFRRKKDIEYNMVTDSESEANHNDNAIPPETLCFFLDAYGPPILLYAQVPWVPTIDFTVHFFSPPESDPGSESIIKSESDSDQSASELELLPIRYSTTVCERGMLEQDGTIFHPKTRKVLARSRQMMRLYKPPVASVNRSKSKEKVKDANIFKSKL